MTDDIKDRHTGEAAQFLADARRAAHERVIAANQARTDAIASAKNQAQSKLDTAHKNAGTVLGQNLQQVALADAQGAAWLANATGARTATLSSNGATSIAVDQAAGRVYWAERADAAKLGWTPLRSVSGSPAVRVRFENATSMPLDLYWADYGGNDVKYATISPGGTYDQGTYATHPWRLVEPLTGVQIQTYTATTEPSQNCRIVLQSQNGARATTLLVRNMTHRTVEVLWLNYQGQEQRYAVLGPRESWKQNGTYMTHPWVVRDQNSRELLALCTGGIENFTLDARERAPLRSIEGSKGVQLQFVNNAPYAVQIFWLNYQGQEQNYAELAPGASYSINTFVTHPWRVRESSSGSEVLVYQPSTAPSQSCVITQTLARLAERAEGLWDDEVALYEHVGYQGQLLLVHADLAQIGALPGWDNRVSSIKVGAAVQAEVFAEPNYQGASQTIAGPIDSLFGTTIGNDTISSLRFHRLGTRIASATLAGGDQHTIAGVAADAVRALALDFAQGQLYFLDGTGGLWRVGSAGQNLTRLTTLPGGPFAAAQLTLDLAHGTLYWSGGSSIGTAKLDGSAQRVLAGQLAAAAPPLVVDGDGGKLYWNDGAQIWQAGLDGTAARAIYKLATRGEGLDIDIATQMLYWVAQGTLMRARTDGADTPQSVVTLPNGGSAIIALDLVTLTGAASQRLRAAQLAHRLARAQAADKVAQAHQQATIDRQNAQTHLQQEHARADSMIDTKQGDAAQRRAASQQKLQQVRIAARSQVSNAQDQADARIKEAHTQAQQIKDSAQQQANEQVQPVQAKLDDARRRKQNL